MNINQIARNQQLMYRFIDRGAGSAYASQLSALNGFGTSSGVSDKTSSLLQSMGISGLQGRTIREMAQYQMRTQNAQKSADTRQAAAETGASSASAAQRLSIREQYTPISDEATKAMQEQALSDAKNSSGAANGLDQTARVGALREQMRSVEPAKRTASYNTMNKVWENEIDRIGKFIKEKDANWKDWGDKFDTAILDDYKAGVNVWV